MLTSNSSELIFSLPVSLHILRNGSAQDAAIVFLMKCLLINILKNKFLGPKDKAIAMNEGSLTLLLLVKLQK